MEALLAKARLADVVPEACGAKVTVNGAELPAAMVSGSEIPLSANSGLVTLADDTVTLAPVAVSVPLLAKLVPTVTQQINQGVALIAYGTRTASEQAARLEQLLAPTCKLLKVAETQMRAFGDVTSCGPALVAACIDELCRRASATSPGLSVHDLATACIETLGATANLLRSGTTPQDLICEVAVPGGMTEAGITVLRKSLPDLLEAISSATRQTEQTKRATLSLGD